MKGFIMEERIAIIVTAAGTALATKGIEGPINSFNDLWDGAIGHRIKAWSEERKIKAFDNLNKLKEDVALKLNKIPQENLKDPEVSIVGPALESAKYYCDEDILRQMFANVIASSMDNRISSKVHQSFVEVIKQMSPMDATLLKLFLAEPRLPIADINLKLESNGIIPLFQFYFLDPSNGADDIVSNAISISNLIRLGILSTPGELSSFTDKSRYSQLESGSAINTFKNQYPIGQPFGDSIIKEVNLKHSFIGLTPYGTSFVSICVS